MLRAAVPDANRKYPKESVVSVASLFSLRNFRKLLLNLPLGQAIGCFKQRSYVQLLSTTK